MRSQSESGGVPESYRILREGLSERESFFSKLLGSLEFCVFGGVEVAQRNAKQIHEETKDTNTHTLSLSLSDCGDQGNLRDLFDASLVPFSDYTPVPLFFCFAFSPYSSPFRFSCPVVMSFSYYFFFLLKIWNFKTGRYRCLSDRSILIIINFI